MQPMPPRSFVLSDFDFHLSPDLIAQTPAPERSASRLLDGRGDTPVDRIFKELPTLLQAGDLLVFNDTQVVPARLFGEKASGGQLGPRSPDRYPPLFVDATRALKVGAVAGPVRSGAGFHLLKLLERQMPGDDLNSAVQTRVRHILLRPSPRLSEAAARARLADFAKRVRSQVTDFAQLAREFSDDPSAKAGGDLGWVTPGMLVPEFEQVMDALAPGDVSEPLVSRFGVHLVQVLERREVPLTDKEKRELARRELRDRKTEEALRTWLQDLRGRAYIEYRESPV
jgi:peptidyl-prolyl cis-trans isomerase SurA